MLSEQDEREFVEDGRSPARRAAFRAVGEPPQVANLDELFAFLDGFQRVFGPFLVSRRISRTALNTL